MSDCSDRSYRVLAARYLRRQTKQLGECLAGVRLGEDIEFIHRARVASRRLRAALGMFRDCWKRKKVKRWRAEIRGLMRQLGSARDKDVQIEFLCTVLGDTTEKAHALGITRLLARIEHEREQYQPGVLRAIEQFEKNKIVDEIQRATKKVLAHSDADVPVTSDIARTQTRRAIIKQIKELLFDQESLEDFNDHRRHHGMRIAAKHLRYTLEIAKPVYAGQLDDIIETTKKVQSLLGDIHDCDVWLAQLDAFSREMQARVQTYFRSTSRMARLSPGIDYLAADRRAHRRKVFDELVQYWHELAQKGTWERLVRIVESPAAAPPVAEQKISEPPAPEVAASEPSVQGPVTQDSNGARNGDSHFKNGSSAHASLVGQ